MHEDDTGEKLVAATDRRGTSQIIEKEDLGEEDEDHIYWKESLLPIAA